MKDAVLVCFAVPQEAKPFRKASRAAAHVRVLVTGMGARHAEAAIQGALQAGRPARVITCGFAGALDPALKVGDVLFDTADVLLAARLSAAGAQRGTFCCAERVATTRAEKAALRAEHNARAVEMESAVISRACAGVGVPCATVRAISDAADEDLPLDFNSVMTADQKISPAKLGLAILSSPQRIPGLIRLGRNSAFAANALARVLAQVI